MHNNVYNSLKVHSAQEYNDLLLSGRIPAELQNKAIPALFTEGKIKRAALSNEGTKNRKWNFITRQNRALTDNMFDEILFRMGAIAAPGDMKDNYTKIKFRILPSVLSTSNLSNKEALSYELIGYLDPSRDDFRNFDNSPIRDIAFKNLNVEPCYEQMQVIADYDENDAKELYFTLHDRYADEYDNNYRDKALLSIRINDEILKTTGWKYTGQYYNPKEVEIDEELSYIAIRLNPELWCAIQTAYDMYYRDTDTRAKLENINTNPLAATDYFWELTQRRYERLLKLYDLSDSDVEYGVFEDVADKMTNIIKKDYRKANRKISDDDAREEAESVFIFICAVRLETQKPKPKISENIQRLVDQKMKKLNL